MIFAGNIGEAQDLGALIKCVEILQSKKVSVLFSMVGDGRNRRWLESEIKRKGLSSYFIFHGSHPLEAMPEFYSKADVAFVSLKRDYIFERTIPGKVQSYMIAGLPILSMLDGEGSRLVSDSNCGLTSPSGDYLSLAKNIIRFVGMEETELRELGLNGCSYAREHFSKDNLMYQLESYMNDLVIEGRV